MFNNFKIQINFMHALLNLIKEKWYILFYMLVNIGFIFSIPSEYTIFLEYTFIVLLLILGGFIIFYSLEIYLQKIDELCEEHNIAHFF